MKKRKSALVRFFLIFSVLCLLIVPLRAVMPTMSDIMLYDNIIRLHVIANSDSEVDQDVKLSVRDEVLESVRELLGEVKDRSLAEKILLENLESIENKAEALLCERGFSYSVKATLTKEVYPKREYGGYSLPAGEYTSLRIMLGKAEGQNWWCVLFPSLCTPYGTAEKFSDDQLAEAGLTPSQIKIITGSSGEVKIKFRLLELISKWFS